MADGACPDLKGTAENVTTGMGREAHPGVSERQNLIKPPSWNTRPTSTDCGCSYDVVP